MTNSEYFDKNMQEVEKCIERENEKLGIQYIGTEHLLFAILKIKPACAAAKILNEMNVTEEDFAEYFYDSMKYGVPVKGETIRLKHILLSAGECALKSGIEIKPEHVLLAMLDLQTSVQFYFNRCNVDETLLRKRIKELIPEEKN